MFDLLEKPEVLRSEHKDSIDKPLTNIVMHTWLLAPDTSMHGILASTSRDTVGSDKLKRAIPGVRATELLLFFFMYLYCIIKSHYGIIILHFSLLASKASPLPPIF